MFTGQISVTNAITMNAPLNACKSVVIRFPKSPNHGTAFLRRPDGLGSPSTGESCTLANAGMDSDLLAIPGTRKWHRFAFPRRHEPDQVPRVCSQPACHRLQPVADTPSDTVDDCRCER